MNAISTHHLWCLEGQFVVSDGEVLGAFSSARMGSYTEKELFVLYSILFIFSFAAFQLPAVDVWFSVNVLHCWPTNLYLETWGNFVPILQVSLDLSWVNKKNCCQCWDWNPVVTWGLLLTFYHLLAQRGSQIIFFLLFFTGVRTKYINWIGTL